MRGSPLQLDDFTLVRLALECRRGSPEEAVDGPEQDLSVKCSAARNKENPSRFRVRLDLAVKTRPGHSGLDAEAAAYGLFSFPESTDDREMRYLARINGGTILYGVLRGQLAMVSGSFPGQKFVLPAVVMQDILALPEDAAEGANTARQDESEKASLPRPEDTANEDTKEAPAARKRSGARKPSRKQPPKAKE